MNGFIEESCYSNPDASDIKILFIFFSFYLF